MDQAYTLAPIRSEARYRGAFAGIAFDLLATPLPLVKRLFKDLGPYGLSIRDIKLETPTLGDAHLDCVLNEINCVARMYLDRLEIDYLKLHEIGTEVATRVAVLVLDAM